MQNSYRKDSKKISLEELIEFLKEREYMEVPEMDLPSILENFREKLDLDD